MDHIWREVYYAQYSEWLWSDDNVLMVQSGPFIRAVWMPRASVNTLGVEEVSDTHSLSPYPNT